MIAFVSVFRDPVMYARCITENPFCAGGRFMGYDNADDNVPIPVRYNSFIDTLSADSDCWVFFCHEDWQLRQDASELVAGLDKGCIYGPIGVYLASVPFGDYIVMKGQVTQCAKDGSSVRNIRGTLRSGRVDTLDCQCVIVHSSLLVRYGLRFDESLAFDMYAEEFCADAFLSAGIVTRAVRMKCTHFSEGSLSDGFLRSLDHARRKYSGSAKRFATIVGYKTVFGGAAAGRPVHRFRLRFPFI